MKSGIYLIKNKKNDKKYIGSTILNQGFKKRWKNHLKSLKSNCHKNHYLQSSWNKYGGKIFEFIVLEICADDKLTEREQYWIDFYKTNNRKFGYNLREAGPRGKMGEESKKKMSLFRKKWSKEHPEIVKKNISHLSKVNKGNKYCLGKKASLKTKEKLRKASGGEKNGFYGKKHTKETKQKLKLLRVGKRATEKTKKKMSISRIGNTNCLGRHLSEEHKIKVGLAGIGRKHSEKTKQKMRDSWKIRRKIKKNLFVQ